MSAPASADRHAEYNKPKLFLVSVLALATAGIGFSIRGDTLIAQTIHTRPAAGASGLPFQEPDEPFLREVPVVREDFVNSLLPHDVHGNAVHEAVLLVRTPLI